jgi:hypothetical protein
MNRNKDEGGDMHRIALLLLLCFVGSVYADSTPPDACKLLTAMDVEKTVGAGFKPSPFRGTASDNSNCGYLKDQNSVVNLLVVNAGQEMSTALKELQKLHAQRNHKVVPIEGAGDGAFYLETVNAITKQPVVAAHFGKGVWHGVLEVKINGKHDIDSMVKLSRIVFPRFQ